MPAVKHLYVPEWHYFGLGIWQHQWSPTVGKEKKTTHTSVPLILAYFIQFVPVLSIRCLSNQTCKDWLHYKEHYKRTVTKWWWSNMYNQLKGFFSQHILPLKDTIFHLVLKTQQEENSNTVSNSSGVLSQEKNAILPWKPFLKKSSLKPVIFLLWFALNKRAFSEEQPPQSFLQPPFSNKTQSSLDFNYKWKA